MSSSVTKLLKDYYETALQTKGVNFAGLAWPSAESTLQRYLVVSDLFRSREAQNTQISLLDIGCGPGFYLDYLQAQVDLTIDYHGIDISEHMIETAQARHPAAQFEVIDILTDTSSAKQYDYAIANGILTVKSDASFDDMRTFSETFLKRAFGMVKKGLAINFMSEHVDWKRDDLFHYPFDMAAAFISKDLTRHYVVRADYGLYEYTMYLFRSPADTPEAIAGNPLVDILKGEQS